MTKHLKQYIIILLFLALNGVCFNLRAEQITVSNPDEFIGEKIIVDEDYSAYVNKIHVHVMLPENYALLTKAKPKLTLRDKEGQVIKQFFIEELASNFTLGRNIDSDQLYAELNLYYCKQGDEGLCLIQNVLYEIRLFKSDVAGNLNLLYDIQPYS